MEQQISNPRPPSEDSLTAQIDRSFITSYLLLGNNSQAEAATLNAIGLWNPESGGQALFQGAVEAALRSLNLDPDALRTEPFRVKLWLPVELSPVLWLPQALRICYVLRVLVGLPAEVLHQITGIEPRRADRLAATAMALLNGPHKASEKKKGQTRPMHQLNVNEVRKLAYRLWQERGCPADSPNEDWFRAEDELRRTRPAVEPALFSLAMGPAEE